jgi:hypothetical protein
MLNVIQTDRQTHDGEQSLIAILRTRLKTILLKFMAKQ